MKAQVITSYGGPEVLEYRQDVTVPAIEGNQILLRVKAASLNPLDLKVQQGMLKILYGNKFPMILGYDAAGEIVALGSKVRGFSLGDRVFGMIDGNSSRSPWGFTKPGSFGEFAATRADCLAIIPEGISFKEAAACSLCGLTAYQAITERGEVKKGQRILIIGASGGVGHLAVQMAQSLGAHVTAICGGSGMKTLKDMGVKKVHNYRETALEALPGGFDLIFDVTAQYKLKEVRWLLGRRGLFISNIAHPLIQYLPWLRGIEHFGSYSYTWVQPNGDNLKILADMMVNKEIKPIIHRTFPLEEMVQAQHYCREESFPGKIVVRI